MGLLGRWSATCPHSHGLAFGPGGDMAGQRWKELFPERWNEALSPTAPSRAEEKSPWLGSMREHSLNPGAGVLLCTVSRVTLASSCPRRILTRKRKSQSKGHGQERRPCGD